MFRKYIVPLLALAGVVLAVFAVIRGDSHPPLATPVSDAPQTPYPTSVAGSGIVEASTENISVGTPIAGIVSEIFVQVGSNVKAGNPCLPLMIAPCAQNWPCAVRRFVLPRHNSPTPNTNSQSPMGSRPWPHQHRRSRKEALRHTEGRSADGPGAIGTEIQ